MRCLIKWLYFTDLFQANFQLLQNTQKETCFLKYVFAGVRKSRLQDCSVRKKGSVSQNITGTWGKNVSKKTTGWIEGMNFCSISHLMSCKMPNCIVLFIFLFFCNTNHREDSYGSTSTANNISFQLRQTWSFCKYGLVLFLSLVYLVYCSVSVVIF